MVRRLPPLNALRAFEAAARHESFTLAARELNVAHAAVSRHIRTLETTLRVALFERTGRGVRLTDEGRALATGMTEAFDLMSAATRRYVVRPARRRRLTISADVSLATHWLAPRLGRFIRNHPDIELSIEPSHRLVDFAKEPFDFGLRFGAGKWRGVSAELLHEAEFFVVCGPQLLAGKPAPAPRDLEPRLLLQDEDWGLWPAWFAAFGAKPIEATGPRLLHDLALPAAEAGQGFALTDRLVSADALAAGRLVRPYAASVKTYGYYLVRKPGANLSKPASGFRDWLKSEIAESLRCDIPAANSRRSETSRATRRKIAR